MDIGNKTFLSIMAMRHMTALCVYEIEQKRHTAIVDEDALDILMIRWEAANLMAKFMATEDDPPTCLTGQIQAVCDEETIRCIYDWMASYYEAKVCSQDVIPVSNTYHSSGGPTPGVGVFGPIANFTVETGIIGFPSLFDGTTSVNNTTGDNTTLEYEWDFGDGNTSGPTVGLTNPSHTYGAAGNYVACLTVTDTDNMLSHTRCVAVIVGSPLAGIGAMVIESNFIVS